MGDLADDRRWIGTGMQRDIETGGETETEGRNIANH